MSIYSWEVFVTVAEQQSFVRAAEILHVSQSAVSHVIKKLEEENNMILFIRNRNKVELTTNGRIIMPLVRNLLECDHALDQMLSELESVTKGVVRLAAFNSVSKDGDWALNIRSVVIFGRIRIVDDTEDELKRKIAAGLCRKFTDDEEFLQNELTHALPRAAFMELTPEHITGKLVNES